MKIITRAGQEEFCTESGAEGCGWRSAGVYLSKDLMSIAGHALKANITTLGPLVLPISEQLLFFVNLVMRKACPICACAIPHRTCFILTFASALQRPKVPARDKNAHLILTFLCLWGALIELHTSSYNSAMFGLLFH